MKGPNPCCRHNEDDATPNKGGSGVVGNVLDPLVATMFPATPLFFIVTVKNRIPFFPSFAIRRRRDGIIFWDFAVPRYRVMRFAQAAFLA